MRGAADGRCVGRRMHVRRVRPDGHVHGDGRRARARPAAPGCGRELGVGDLAQAPPQRFAHAQPIAIAGRDGFVHLAPGFFGRAEAPVGQDRFHILAGMAGHGDFEIVNRRRAIHGEPGGVSALHQIDQHRRQAALDHVPAHAPDDGSPPRARRVDGVHHGAEGIARQDVRQRIQPSRDARAFAIDGGEIGDADLAAARLEAGRSSGPAKSSGLLGVFAHAAAFLLPITLRSASAV